MRRSFAPARTRFHHRAHLHVLRVGRTPNISVSAPGRRSRSTDGLMLDASPVKIVQAEEVGRVVQQDLVEFLPFSQSLHGPAPLRFDPGQVRRYPGRSSVQPQRPVPGTASNNKATAVPREWRWIERAPDARRGGRSPAGVGRKLSGRQEVCQGCRPRSGVALGGEGSCPLARGAPGLQGIGAGISRWSWSGGQAFSHLLQILVYKLDCHRALAHRRGDAIDRAGAHVPCGENASWSGRPCNRSGE